MVKNIVAGSIKNNQIKIKVDVDWWKKTNKKSRK